MSQIYSKVIGATAASGANGFTSGITAINSAMATAVTTAIAATGYLANTAAVSAVTINVDVNSLIFEFYQTLTYVAT